MSVYGFDSYPKHTEAIIDFSFLKWNGLTTKSKRSNTIHTVCNWMNIYSLRCMVWFQTQMTTKWIILRHVVMPDSVFNKKCDFYSCRVLWGLKETRVKEWVIAVWSHCVHRAFIINTRLLMCCVDSFRVTSHLRAWWDPSPDRSANNLSTVKNICSFAKRLRDMHWNAPEVLLYLGWF